jgi:hypothetical protein
LWYWPTKTSSPHWCHFKRDKLHRANKICKLAYLY